MAAEYIETMISDGYRYLLVNKMLKIGTTRQGSLLIKDTTNQ